MLSTSGYTCLGLQMGNDSAEQKSLAAPDQDGILNGDS